MKTYGYKNGELKMKILSIGNSFSQDAHKWLHALAKQNGIEIETTNLYIGGCSLKTHWENIVENNTNYDLEINGGKCVRKISIDEALKLDKFDVITFQQRSGHSGLIETYFPYLSNIDIVVRELQPDAKIMFHQTWAYETDSVHKEFENYNSNQDEMFKKIIETTEKAAEEIDADIIPTGRVIQKLRKTVKEFDYTNGGKSLCRDGSHLSYDYGRYAAAATWIRAIARKNVSEFPFEDFDVEILKKITKTVNSVVK